MRDEIMRLITQWRHNAQGCGKRDAHAAGTWRSCARELEAALARTDHTEDKLGMVAEGMSGLVEALDAVMAESLLGEGSDIWKGNRGKQRNRLPENVGAILAKMRTLIAATPAPDHSAGVGGMVASIDSAPKNKPILISDGVSIPDVVQWHAEKPAHDNFLAVREGWFSINGGRSRFCTVVSSSDWGAAKVWAEIPAGLSALAQPADADGGK